MKRIIAMAFAAITICSCTYKTLTEWPEGCEPEVMGKRIAERFLNGDDERTFSDNIHYSVVSEWVNCIEFARLTGNKDMEEGLIAKLPHFYTDEGRSLLPIRKHVDHTIFGSVPLEVYLMTKDSTWLDKGIEYADLQWCEPDDSIANDIPFEKQLQYWKDGYSNQTRLWIDDMYMITLLQTQAFRATGDEKYIRRTAKEMVLYLDELQNEDGLFYHAPDVPFVWGRGDGWVSAGMPMILKYLPQDDPSFEPILAGYLKMMAALLKYQREDGLWNELVNDNDGQNWAESSCSAMFTYAFIEGCAHGWLGKEYAQAARKAWIALCGRVGEDGALSEICVGTAKKNNHQYYLDRPRRTGDPHGQTAMMWIANALTANFGK